MAITFSDALETGLEYEYRWRIAKLFERIDFLGVSHWRDDPSLPLTQLYVPLNLTTEPGRSDKTEWLSVGDALEHNRHLVVLGDPGAGKSTLIKLLAYSFATPEPTPLNRRFGPLLPIPIILKDYDVRSWSNRNDMLRDFIAFTVPSQIREQVTVEWLEAALFQGRAILLIDGLDEVGDRQTRESLKSRVLVPWHHLCAKSQIVSTSRVIGYDEVPIDDYSVVVEIFDGGGKSLHRNRTSASRFYVAPFDEAAIDEFALRWYTLREPNETEREQKIVEFRKAIRKNTGTLKLASSPRLLMMMALIFLKGADLPSGRVKLYDRIVETYLVTLQDYKGIGRFAAELEEMKKWLAAVGRYLQERRLEESENENESEILISHTQLLTTLSEAIRQDRPHADASEEARLFLDYAILKGGLLLPRGQRDGKELYAFIHLTFQEYFAAYSIRTEFWDFQKLFSEFDTLAETVRTRASDPRWHESLVLLFEMFREMSGLGDRLIAALSHESGAEERGETLRGTDVNTLVFFCEVLGDADSGLSETTRKKTLDIVLTTLCRVGDRPDLFQAVQGLNELCPDFVPAWFESALQRSPSENPPFIFPYTAEFLGETEGVWRSRLGDYFHRYKEATWPEEQADSVLFWLGEREVVTRWGMERLPLRVWLADWDKSSGYTFEADANLYLPLLFRSKLCGELQIALASVYCVTRISVSLFRCLSLTMYRSSPRSFSLSLFRFLTLSQTHYRSLSRSFSLSRSLYSNRSITLSGSLSFSLILATTIPFPEWAKQGGRLGEILAKTEWLFGMPHEIERRKELIAELDDLMTPEHDDFTRLCVITAKLVLGSGNTALCRERDALLDRAIDPSSDFSFPKKLADDVSLLLPPNERKAIFQHIWLHRKGKPWLNPEWFDRAHADDPTHEAYWLCASPEKLFTRLGNKLKDDDGGELLKRCAELGLTS